MRSPARIFARGRVTGLRAVAAIILLVGSLASGAGGVPPSLDVPHARVTPRMDADPLDPAWANAAEIPSLSLSILPDARARLAPATRVLLLWDAQSLYVRFVCHDDDIYAPFTHHDDPLYTADVVEIFLDPAGDGRQYVEVQVSPGNVTLDKLFLLTTDPRSDQNGKLLDEVLARDFWEFLDWTLPGLRTATSRLPASAGEKNLAPGWLVDVAIPAEPLLHRLGRTQFGPMTLRANLLRYDWPLSTQKTAGGPSPARSLVAMNWSPVIDGCPHISPQAMGSLKLLPP